MKIAILIGTMPDIIKQAPVVWEAEKKGHKVILIHTNQHYDDKLYKGIKDSIGLRNPDYILKSQFNMTDTLEELKEVLILYNPDIVLVHGDTKTAMIGAIAAHYARIPVGHVEAGLRSNNREPWPEQTDSRIADACSNLFFAPHELNRNNLIREGFHPNDILLCGNTVQEMVERFKPKNTLHRIKQVYFSSHREENMRSKKRTTVIVKFANYLQENGYDVIWVMRPKTKQKLAEYRLKLNNGIKIVDHLCYEDSLKLLNESRFACVDSGGLQEEAAILNVPCLTLRYSTDRPETVLCNKNLILSLDLRNMKNWFKQFLINEQVMRDAETPYLIKDSSKLIISFIEDKEKELKEWKNNV